MIRWNHITRRSFNLITLKKFTFSGFIYMSLSNQKKSLEKIDFLQNQLGKSETIGRRGILSSTSSPVFPPSRAELLARV